MEKRPISAVLSEQTVTFRPGGPPSAFDVTVTNDSEQFAGFKLELLAAGTGRNPNWYQLTPEVSTAKPPGGRTQFQIAIVESPIPGFVGAINVTILISSPQLKEERKYLLRLVIEPGTAPTQLLVELPVRQFQVYPRNQVDIPVRVRNLSQQTVDLVLRMAGIEPGWISGGNERRFVVEAGSQREASFQCRPPVASQATSDEYPFFVEAIPQIGTSARAEGSIEVLPVGFVQFNCPAPKQRLPARGGTWWPEWSDAPAHFPLAFKNASNLPQQLAIEVQGRDQKKCTTRLVPPELQLDLGSGAEVQLEAVRRRPWFGLARTLQLEATAVLLDQRLGNADPASHALELRVVPKLPLWMQALLLVTVTISFSYTAVELPRLLGEGHTDLVNSVRVSGDARLVLSGSDDRTIRSWTVDKDSDLHYEGILVDAGKPVRALRFMPRNNSQVAAGLENGAVQLWNVATGEKLRELIYQPALNDRVFDLVFTANSRYLFSGHGSGQVLQWDLLSKDTQPMRVLRLDRKLDYTVQALELSGDERTLISAGRFNRLILWDLDRPDARPRRLSPRGGQNDVIWGLALASQAPTLLATADSQGNITTWDLSKCTETALSSPLPDPGAAPVPGVTLPTSEASLPIDVECPVLDAWKAHGGYAVRSIALSADGRTLISGGDDHRVILWKLTAQGKRDSTLVDGRVLDEHPLKINSVDLSRDRLGVLAVSGGDDHTVTMKRVEP